MVSDILWRASRVANFPFVITLQRYKTNCALPNFDPRFGPILMKNSSKSLTLDRIHASMTLFSLNCDFQHEFAQY